VNDAPQSWGTTAPAWVNLTAVCTARLPRGRWRIARWLSRCHAGVFWNQLPRALGGCWYLCSLRDGIAAEVCFAGRYEAQETLILRAILQPGDIFVDVGANWGYFPLLAARLVGGSGKVICFEPHPVLFEQLCQNIERNSLDYVLPLRVAACDQARDLILEGVEVGSGNSGGSRVVESAGPGKKAYSVAGQPIDDALDRCGVETVACLKMDIEGGEALALKGLRGLRVGRYRRILLEVHPLQLRAQGLTVTEAVLTLQHAGYQGWVIDHTGPATRRASALRPSEAASLLTPLQQAGGPESWRNILWTAPGVQPLCG
jgi:FkbM family methyltransferase